MTARWKFVTMDGAETYEFPINPNTMTSPVPSRDIQWDHPVSGFTGRQGGSTPHPWSFGGVVRSKEQYDAFVLWTNKRTKIRVHTDLGQVFVIRLLAFRPSQEARPRNRHAPWRHEYTFDTLIFKNEGIVDERVAHFATMAFDSNGTRTFAANTPYQPDRGDVSVRFNSNSGGGSVIQYGQPQAARRLWFASAGDYGAVSCPDLGGYAQQVTASAKFWNVPMDNWPSNYSITLQMADHTKPRSWFTDLPGEQANPIYNYFNYAVTFSGEYVTFYKAQTNRAGNGFNMKNITPGPDPNNFKPWPYHTTKGYWTGGEPSVNGFGGQWTIFTIEHNNAGLLTASVTPVSLSNDGAVTRGKPSRVSVQDPGADNVPVYTDVGGGAAITGLSTGQSAYLAEATFVSYGKQMFG